MKPQWPAGIEKKPIPLYGGSLVICRSRRAHAECRAALGETSAEANKDDEACTELIIDDRGRAFFLVGVFGGGLQSLIHELGHVAFLVLGHVNVPVRSGAANEAYCYLLDALYAMATKKAKSG